MPFSAVREFLKLEAAGGILLIIASALALIIANSPLSGLYVAWLDILVAVRVRRAVGRTAFDLLDQ